MKKEISEVERKRLLKKHHHQKIDYALAKAFINDSDVYKLVKDFFAEYLGLDYEFAHEELNRELNKRFIDDSLKKEISGFLATLSHLQFNAVVKPTQDQLRSMITQFKDIIENLIVFEEQKKYSPFDWLKKIFNKKVAKKPIVETNTGFISQIKPDLKLDTSVKLTPEQEQISEASPSSITEQNKNMLVENALKELEESVTPETPESIIKQLDNFIANKKVSLAREMYKKLMQKYNQLSDLEKKKYYSIVNEYYNKLSN